MNGGVRVRVFETQDRSSWPPSALQERMQIARRGAGALAAGGEPGGNGDNQRNGRDQTHPLMDFQHVCAFIEQRLLLGVSLGLLRRKAEIRKRRRRRTAGRGIRQILL